MLYTPPISILNLTILIMFGMDEFKNMKLTRTALFWVVTPYSLVDNYQTFRIKLLHLQATGLIIRGGSSLVILLQPRRSLVVN
jgi:hypothetical protein